MAFLEKRNIKERRKKTFTTSEPFQMAVLGGSCKKKEKRTVNSVPIKKKT